MEERDSVQEVVPVLAEELHVAKEQVPGEGVRVHRRVEEHDELVDIPLKKQTVEVRRVVVDREVDGPMPVRREGGTTIIPVVQEELVVTKRYVLKEEIHVVRRLHQERHQEKVTLQRQEVEVEKVDAEGRTVLTPPPRRTRRRSILGNRSTTR